MEAENLYGGNVANAEMNGKPKFLIECMGLGAQTVIRKEEIKMLSRANKYFALGKQYYDSSILLLETIIKNDNCSLGIGFSDELALKNFNENIKKSDARLLIHALFLSYQCVELYVKGLLLLKNNSIKNEHEISIFYNDLEKNYGKNSEIYKAIWCFYANQIDILNKFKKNNDITTINQLYGALRYPEEKNEIIDHFSLKYNGSSVIKQIKKIIKILKKVDEEVLEEYKKEINNI